MPLVSEHGHGGQSGSVKRVGHQSVVVAVMADSKVSGE